MSIQIPQYGSDGGLGQSTIIITGSSGGPSTSGSNRVTVGTGGGGSLSRPWSGNVWPPVVSNQWSGAYGPGFSLTAYNVSVANLNAGGSAPSDGAIQYGCLPKNLMAYTGSEELQDAFANNCRRSGLQPTVDGTHSWSSMVCCSVNPDSAQATFVAFRTPGANDVRVGVFHNTLAFGYDSASPYNYDSLPVVPPTVEHTIAIATATYTPAAIIPVKGNAAYALIYYTHATGYRYDWVNLTTGATALFYEDIAADDKAASIGQIVYDPTNDRYFGLFWANDTDPFTSKITLRQLTPNQPITTDDLLAAAGNLLHEDFMWVAPEQFWSAGLAVAPDGQLWVSSDRSPDQFVTWPNGDALCAHFDADLNLIGKAVGQAHKHPGVGVVALLQTSCGLIGWKEGTVHEQLEVPGLYYSDSQNGWYILPPGADVTTPSGYSSLQSGLVAGRTVGVGIGPGGSGPGMLYEPNLSAWRAPHLCSGVAVWMPGTNGSKLAFFNDDRAGVLLEDVPVVQTATPQYLNYDALPLPVVDYTDQATIKAAADNLRKSAIVDTTGLTGDGDVVAYKTDATTAYFVGRDIAAGEFRVYTSTLPLSAGDLSAVTPAVPADETLRYSINHVAHGSDFELFPVFGSDYAIVRHRGNSVQPNDVAILVNLATGANYEIYDITDPGPGTAYYPYSFELVYNPFAGNYILFRSVEQVGETDEHLDVGYSFFTWGDTFADIAAFRDETPNFSVSHKDVPPLSDALYVARDGSLVSVLPPEGGDDAETTHYLSDGTLITASGPDIFTSFVDSQARPDTVLLLDRPNASFLYSLRRFQWAVHDMSVPGVVARRRELQFPQVYAGVYDQDLANRFVEPNPFGDVLPDYISFDRAHWASASALWAVYTSAPASQSLVTRFETGISYVDEVTGAATCAGGGLISHRTAFELCDSGGAYIEFHLEGGAACTGDLGGFGFFFTGADTDAEPGKMNDGAMLYIESGQATSYVNGVATMLGAAPASIDVIGAEFSNDGEGTLTVSWWLDGVSYGTRTLPVPADRIVFIGAYLTTDPACTVLLRSDAVHQDYLGSQPPAGEYACLTHDVDDPNAPTETLTLELSSDLVVAAYVFDLDDDAIEEGVTVVSHAIDTQYEDVEVAAVQITGETSDELTDQSIWEQPEDVTEVCVQAVSLSFEADDLSLCEAVVVSEVVYDDISYTTDLDEVEVTIAQSATDQEDSEITDLAEIGFSVLFEEGPDTYIDLPAYVAPSPDGTIYCMNMNTLGVTQYADLPAVAVASYGDVGIVLLDTSLRTFEGSDDNGDDIDARLLTGRMFFRSQNDKHFFRVYVTGLGSALRFTTYSSEDGEPQERAYLLEEHVITEHRTRFRKMGRGATSPYWALAVENVSGGVLDFNKLEALVGESRRLR